MKIKNILLVILGLFCLFIGYLLGRGKLLPVTEDLKVKVVNVTEDNLKVSPETLLNLERQNRKASFLAQLKNYETDLANMQEKLEGAKRIADYFHTKTEDGNNSPSIEASLAYEGKYRENLIFIVSLQQQMILTYNEMLKAFKEYEDFLQFSMQKKALK